MYVPVSLINISILPSQNLWARNVQDCKFPCSSNQVGNFGPKRIWILSGDLLSRDSVQGCCPPNSASVYWCQIKMQRQNFGGVEKGVALLICQGKEEAQTNALMTMPHLLGSWKRSYSFRMENRAVDMDWGWCSSCVLLLGALKSLGLVSGDSRTCSPQGFPSLIFSFWNEECSQGKGVLGSIIWRSKHQA